ncbi:MAG: Rab family GTPase [Promethearchaeota archaeon]
MVAAEKKRASPNIVKVFVAGEGGVGKTTLIKRFCEGIFVPDTLMTIGVEFAVKTLPHFEGLTLQIWDLGGEDRFRFILPNYCRGAAGGLLVFDLSRFMTFANLGDWIDLLKGVVPDVPIVLIGTKTDLGVHSVDENAINQFIQERGLAGYFETSSKTGQNVDDAFAHLVKEMMPGRFDD